MGAAADGFPVKYNDLVSISDRLEPVSDHDDCLIFSQGIKSGMKTALIMEGGAMRGMFTCGVIDVLMQNGITFDGAAGISAGAVFGCNFKSGQIGHAEKNPDELERVYRIGVHEAEKRLEDIRTFLAEDDA